MTIRTTRDWRGIKHELSKYSTPELLGVLSHAQRTRAQLDDFLESVAAELRHRETSPAPVPA